MYRYSSIFSLLLLSATLVLAASVRHTHPSREDWTGLNKTLGGRLQPVTPLARPCFARLNGAAVASQPELCAVVQAQYTTPAYRVDQIAAYQETQSEACPAAGAAQQCLLDPSQLTTSNPLGQVGVNQTSLSCNQGALPAYTVPVGTADDVKRALAFASRTRATISIKNSGHDYNGRSSGPGSLGLWTRQLQDLSYEPAFVPEGCDSAGEQGAAAGGTSTPDRPVAAITMGAGVNFDQVYAFAHRHNVTYLGGSGPTVGASGAWLMAGGHGILSRAYGLGVDRVLQFRVVTADGVVRVANACQNQDLFWALRGGGGATFGVVLESTSRVEPEQVGLAVAAVSLPADAPLPVQAEWQDLLVNSTLQWAAEGWGGFQGVGVSLVATPLLSLADAQSSMETLVSFAQAHGGAATVEALPDFYALYTKYILPAAQPGGSATLSHNWMIPSRAYATEAGRKELRDHMDWLASVGLAPGFLVTTPYLYSGTGSAKAKAYAYGPPDATSTTPAWRSSAAMLNTGAGWAYNASTEDKQAVARLLAEASRRAQRLWPDGGAYVNEAHPWVDDWQSAFWGRNYARLAQLKRRFDAGGLLGCWHCVASESGGNADVVGGSCLGRLI